MRDGLKLSRQSFRNLPETINQPLLSGRNQDQFEPILASPANSRSIKMTKRPNAIQIDRLAKALKHYGFEPKRHQLLEIAANAFGYRNSNEFTAANVSPPMAEPIGTIDIDGSVVVLARDAMSSAIFAVEESFLDRVSANERAETILPTPYGHLANVSRLLDDELPDLDKSHSITSAIMHNSIKNKDALYVMETIANDERLYWSNEDGWASLESAMLFPDKLVNMPMADQEIVWMTWKEACANRSHVENCVGAEIYSKAKKIAALIPEEGKATASFTPQEWINDHAIECDSPSDKTYDVTVDLIAFALLKKSKTIENYLNNTNNDEFIEATHAPDWIQKWSGPFNIEIQVNVDTMLLNLQTTYYHIIRKSQA
jgi:hypothetical protein